MISLRRRFVWPIVAGLAVVAPVAFADQLFLGVSGIEGSSTDERFPKQLEIASYSFGASRMPSLGGGAPMQGTTHPLVVSRRIDQASPKLLEAAGSGTAIPMAVLSIVNPQGVVTTTLTLSMVEVIDYQQTGSASPNAEAPTEQFSLYYETLVFSHTPVTPDGRPGTPITGTVGRTRAAAAR